MDARSFSEHVAILGALADAKSVRCLAGARAVPAVK
jgi:hypothetical protein